MHGDCIARVGGVRIKKGRMMILLSLLLFHFLEIHECEKMYNEYWVCSPSKEEEGGREAVFACSSPSLHLHLPHLVLTTKEERM